MISAVLDVAAGFAIHLAVARAGKSTHPSGHFPTIGTIDLHVDYLRPGRGKYFIATGRVVRLGNRVAVAHMDLVNDDRRADRDGRRGVYGGVAASLSLRTRTSC